ncbi:MAG: DUF1822 family protein [Elainella sp. C42_A2020_010]|nr:DUF1822 family protein [Elainella sp. C42_A2020_010]
MTTTFPQQLTVTLPMTRLARETADQFAQQQPTPAKAEQVRQNTLAVYALQDYCQMLGIATDLNAGDSWQPLKRLAANVADLELVGVGRLECRPVEPNASVCLIPPEVWADRLGYVAVQLDLVNLEATLLGFVPTVTTEHLPLDQFDSLDALIDRVHLEQQAAPSISRMATDLGQWLVGQATASWQTIESLLDSLYTEPAFAFRSAAETTSEDIPAESETLRRAKLIHLSTATVDYPLVLVVEVRPRSEQQRSVYVQIHPIEAGTGLPAGLRLVGLDQAGSVVLETRTRPADDYIQLRFRGRPGELLRLEIELQDTVLSEHFVV